MNFVYMIRDIKENLIVLEKYFVTWIFEISRYLSLLRSLCGIFGTKYRGTHSVAITGFFFHQQLHIRGIYRIYSHWISSNQLFSYSFSKNFKTLLSRNFCQKSVRVNFWNFHSELWKKSVQSLHYTMHVQTLNSNSYVLILCSLGFKVLSNSTNLIWIMAHFNLLCFEEICFIFWS